MYNFFLGSYGNSVCSPGKEQTHEVFPTQKKHHSAPHVMSCFLFQKNPPKQKWPNNIIHSWHNVKRSPPGLLANFLPGHFKRKVVFQPCIFRSYVSFGERTCFHPLYHNNQLRWTDQCQQPEDDGSNSVNILPSIVVTTNKKVRDLVNKGHCVSI